MPSGKGGELNGHVLCLCAKNFEEECPYCRSKNVDEPTTSRDPAPFSVRLSSVYDAGVRFCFDCRQAFLLID